MSRFKFQEGYERCMRNKLVSALYIVHHHQQQKNKNTTAAAAEKSLIGSRPFAIENVAASYMYRTPVKTFV